MTAKRYKLVLINPRQKFRHYSTQFDLVKIMGKKNSMPSLALALVAALTPSHYDITIVDEDLESIDLSTIPADIVGITTPSNTIRRAYEIADKFRSRGITVILGGPHVTYMVEEALEHADSVVIGEAEGAWERALADFECGVLCKSYKTEEPVPYTASPIPRWDLIKTKEYVMIPFQASRGCPFNCEFCVVTKIFGKKSRLRDVEDIVREIKALPMKRIFFIDDNLTINRPFARKLMPALQGLGISWICQASIDIADDEALLQEMAEAGCENILIGFESLNPESLRETHKFHNVHKNYAQAIDKIHAKGIHVFASLVVGFDHDTLESFDAIFDFSMQTNIPFTSVNILCTSPGTDLQARLDREGRLLPVPPEFLGGLFPVLKYKNMEPVPMFLKFLEVLDKLYSFDTLFKKAQGLFDSGRFIRKKNDPDVTILRKINITFRMIWYFILTRNVSRREIFFYLIGLARRKKIAMERVFIFLLAMEGLRRGIDHLIDGKEEFVKIIKEYSGTENLR